MRTILSFALVLFSVAAGAQIKDVTVRAVHDAQVLTVFSEEYDEEFTMILVGMSCPGLEQPYGKEARDLVANATLGKTVRIRPVNIGPSGVLLGLIYTQKGEYLNEELIKQGLAQADDRETEWLKLEEEARSKKLGIWKDHPTIDLEKDWAEHHHLKDRIKLEEVEE